MSPTIIVVAGTSSNVGKTTVVCDLLELLPDWEAIKVTRGHSRSCGKDPEACCVSHLLGPQPTVHSDPVETRVHGKDTDRFWRAGASAVHWVIAKSDQVEQGLIEALSRVRAVGVIVEATSALAFLDPVFSILVASHSSGEIKPSARRALRSGKIGAVYYALALASDASPPAINEAFDGLPVFTSTSKAELLKTVIGRATNTR